MHARNRWIAPAALTLFLFALGALPSVRAEDKPIVVRRAPAARQDLAGLAQRVLDAEGDQQQSVARALATMDLPDALAFVRDLHRTLAARSVASEARRGAAPEAPGAQRSQPEQRTDARVNSAKDLVDFQIRVLRLAEAALPHLGMTAPGERAVQSRTLDVPELKRLLAALEARPDVELLTAPRITALDGQRAEVYLHNQVSYVRDYEIEIQGEHFVADPVIGVVQEGLSLEVRGHIGPRQDDLLVEVRGDWAQLARPIAELTSRVLATDVTLQTPEVTTSPMRCALRLGSGSHLWLAHPTREVKEGVRYIRAVVVSPTVVPRASYEFK